MWQLLPNSITGSVAGNDSTSLEAFLTHSHQLSLFSFSFCCFPSLQTLLTVAQMNLKVAETELVMCVPAVHNTTDEPMLALQSRHLM